VIRPANRDHATSDDDLEILRGRAHFVRLIEIGKNQPESKTADSPGLGQGPPTK
jgi:hypothetical protein